MPRVAISEAAAPVSRAVEKVRLFIIMILSLHPKGRVGSCAARTPRYGAARRDVWPRVAIHRLSAAPASSAAQRCLRAEAGTIFDWSSGRPLPICRQPAVSAPLAHHVPDTWEG